MAARDVRDTARRVAARDVRDTAWRVAARDVRDTAADVKITVEDVTFFAHKEVLSDRSEYFAVRCLDRWQGNQDLIIPAEFEISPADFDIMLNYFYNGTIDLSPQNIEDVLKNARFLLVNSLVTLCCSFIEERLNVENFQTVVDWYDFYCLEQLESCILSFLGKNLVVLSEQPQFNTTLNYELLLKFLQTNNIDTEAPESYILQIVLRWVFKCEEREQHLLSLAKEIRFNELGLTQLNSLPACLLKFDEIKVKVAKAKERPSYISAVEFAGPAPHR